jgi:hypothetical protein
VCALVFLFVSFAHAAHGIDSAGASASYELVLTCGTDDSPHPSKSSSSVEHCQACCGMILVAGDAASLDAADTPDPATWLHASMRPHRPAFDDRPPIASL